MINTNIKCFHGYFNLQNHNNISLKKSKRKDTENFHGKHQKYKNEDLLSLAKSNGQNETPFSDLRKFHSFLFSHKNIPRHRYRRKIN